MLGPQARRSATAAAEGGPGFTPLARRLAAASPFPPPPPLPPPRSSAPSLSAQPCLSPGGSRRLGPAARPSHVTRGGAEGGRQARPALRRHPPRRHRVAGHRRAASSPQGAAAPRPCPAAAERARRGEPASFPPLRLFRCSFPEVKVSVGFLKFSVKIFSEIPRELGYQQPPKSVKMTRLEVCWEYDEQKTLKAATKLVWIYYIGFSPVLTRGMSTHIQ
ncbi:potassium/sodium hyperpolarization-activated cyclic nucleotide-gated channel 2-like [Aquila chrysaetos chrysaetos]|uniref:potassium/sodium hyperpolarization-activated cyclic nucleotide-gated channel 2-like n=1 Tax=Aquila chrysaetos chrysaetos TaxID=223781 RepID=UPI00117715D0|nr:potassium/sodium hyperpolarization-activated cyclic nucleotide-gated channel 2-like [Aquila chrysaetos chrysaetos]